MEHMNTLSQIQRSGFMQTPGAWCLVDGQFGSTGKGLAASVLAEALDRKVGLVTSNAGPNSGHTSYGPNNEKVVLQQLPTFSVASILYHGYMPITYLNAGAIIDPAKLREEINQWLGADYYLDLRIDPQAAVVDDHARQLESNLVKDIGSTGKGTGGAIARKILRYKNAVFSSHPELAKDIDAIWQKRVLCHVAEHDPIFIEVSQGFSLSLNASNMYPFTTSRDCTVSQAMSDAGLHPEFYRGAMMVVRTYPIRVAGNSGPGYLDQMEISWEELGVEPEITTVTKKVRRVFTFSIMQYIQALEVNRPCSLMINFLNYLPAHKRGPFIDRLLEVYEIVMCKKPRLVLLGFGPKNADVKVYS